MTTETCTQTDTAITHEQLIRLTDHTVSSPGKQREYSQNNTYDIIETNKKQQTRHSEPQAHESDTNIRSAIPSEQNTAALYQD